MKIGFDAKRAAQNRTGLGNYSRFIINILSECYPLNNYILYIPNPKKCSLLKELNHERNIIFRFPSAFWRKLASLWRVKQITSCLVTDNIQLYHGLSNELPLNINKAKGIKSIVTIHDLIFLRYPDYYHFIDRKIYAYKFRKACENADQIIAISECTKRDIISFFHIPESKIAVVYQGCDVKFSKSIPDDFKKSIKDKYQLPPEYILTVGSIEERKNLLLLAQALKQTTTEIPVIAIGKRTAYSEQVESFLKDNGLSNRMIMLHNVPFSDLPTFYQMASIFVYPSRFEGFGIPILEALNSQVPVIAATGSCLEEAGGPDSIYINPDDSKALAQAIDLVLTNSDLRKRMIEKGYIYAKQFEDSKLAKDLMDVYQEIGSSKKSIVK